MKYPALKYRWASAFAILVILALLAWYRLNYPATPIGSEGSPHFSSLGNGVEKYSNPAYGVAFVFPAATPVFVSLASSPSTAIDTFGAAGAATPPLAVILDSAAATPKPVTFHFSPQACEMAGGQSTCTLIADTPRIKFIMGNVPHERYQEYQSIFQQIVASFATR